jgi:small GTP-binding protein
MGQTDAKRKIVLLGDSAVGKTSLIRRFVLDSFDDKYITTIGTKITKKEIAVVTPAGRTEMILMIWDILGQQGYTGTQSMSYVGTQGAIFVFDLTRPDTLSSITGYWRPELAKVAGNVPCVLVGNKADLVGERAVPEREVASVSGLLGARHFLSSAKTGEGVEALFAKMAEMSLQSCIAGRTQNDTAVKELRNLTDVADQIITDFVQAFGDQELAMAMVRKQFSRANLDISNPTRSALYDAVRLLSESEQGFKSPGEVNANLVRRRSIIDRCP